MKKIFFLALFFAFQFCKAQIHQPATFMDENQLAYAGTGTTLITDATANNGSCLFKSATNGGSTLWYGPYSHLQAGNYTVQFRLKVGSLASSGYLFQADVSAPSQGIISALAIHSSMFKAPNEWQMISIPVKIRDGINDLEIRGVDFQGGTDIYFDYVEIVPAQLNGLISDEFTILGNGNIGMGTRTPKEKLAVNGNIRAREVKVETANWPDYVFNPNYKITSLSDLETYIKTNNHLPEMPTAKEAETNGIELGEMNKRLLQKVEELTVYLIEKEKEIVELRKQFLKDQESNRSKINSIQLKLKALSK